MSIRLPRIHTLWYDPRTGEIRNTSAGLILLKQLESTAQMQSRRDGRPFQGDAR